MYKYCTILFFVLAISSSISLAEKASYGYWDWFKNGLNAIREMIYLAWNAPPRPRLVNHRSMVLDGEMFEEFRYDLSRDNEGVKNLRKKLHLSGVYLSDDSDVNAYRKYIQQAPVPAQYSENGFDINIDNSISKCMYRLLRHMLVTAGVAVLPARAAIWTQLLSELENVLPVRFDNDQNGDEFIALAQKIAVYAPDSEKNIISPEQILHFWYEYSYRFNKNKGLLAAINQLKIN